MIGRKIEFSYKKSLILLMYVSNILKHSVTVYTVVISYCDWTA